MYRSNDRVSRTDTDGRMMFLVTTSDPGSSSAVSRPHAVRSSRTLSRPSRFSSRIWNRVGVWTAGIRLRLMLRKLSCRSKYASNSSRVSLPSPSRSAASWITPIRSS